MHFLPFDKKIKVLVPTIMLLGIMITTSCKKDKNSNQNAARGGQQKVEVEGIVMNSQPLENKITSTGTLVANEEVELRSETSGRITDIYFEEGSRVKKGQLLVKINDDELKAQLKKFQIENQLLKERERRSRQLFEREGISEDEYQTALNNFQTNQAEIDLLKSQIDKTSIIAPFEGVIGLRNASKGGYISPTSLIAKLQQIDPIKVEFTVPEKFAAFIKTGTPIKFTIEGSETTYDAKVYAIESSVDINTRSVRIRAKGSNPENSLKPGAFAKVEIIVDVINDALLVPSEAIVPVLQGQQVFVVKDGFARAQKVNVGIRTERESQIIQGLTPGDTVVITGLMSLKDSVKVSVKTIRERTRG